LCFAHNTQKNTNFKESKKTRKTHTKTKNRGVSRLTRSDLEKAKNPRGGKKERNALCTQEFPLRQPVNGHGTGKKKKKGKPISS